MLMRNLGLALLLALTFNLTACGGGGGNTPATEQPGDGGGDTGGGDTGGGDTGGGDTGGGDTGGGDTGGGDTGGGDTGGGDTGGGDTGGGDTGGGDTGGDPGFGAPGITLYLLKPDSWANAMVHSWNAQPSGVIADTSWPGVAMTAIGNGWYALHYPAADAINVVFNSGSGQQSADLSRTSSACYQNGSWVEMADCDAPPAPVLLGAAPAGATFYTSALQVTLGLMGAPADAEGRYSLDGSDPAANGTSFRNGQIITLGQQLAVGSSLTLRLAYDGESFSTTYTKGDASAGLTIHAKAPAGWGGVNAHYWNVLPVGSAADTSWPGVAMISLGEGWYRLFLRGAESSNLIFSNNGASQSANLSRNGDGCYDIATSSWSASCTVPALPASVSASLASQSFSSASLKVTLRLAGDDISTGRYSLDGSDPKNAGISYQDGDQLQLGQTLAIGQSLTLRLYAANGEGEASASYTYTRVAPPAADAFSWDNATVYFVLTDRFNDGDSSNNNSYGRERDAQGNIYTGYQNREGTFRGGDFKGLTAKLNEGYFTDLGVNVLWITAPYEQIHGFVGGENFKHYAYHGYYALDFTSVDANLGTPDELRTLIDTAHSQGIRVIFDIVMNHAGYETMGDMDEFGFGALKAGWDSYYFTSNATSIHYDSYADYIDTSAGTATAWGRWWGPQWVRKGSSGSPYPGYDACGGDDLTMCLSGLPDFKTESTASVGLPPILTSKWGAVRTAAEQAELEAFFADQELPPTVANHLIKWMSDWVRDYGVDGFRVDTAKHVSLPVWAELKRQSSLAYEQWKDENPDKLPDNQDLPFWMTGEVWGHGVGRSAYFDNGFDSVINFSFQNQADNLAGLEAVFADYASKINSDPTFNVLSYISSHDTSLFARNKLIDAGTSLLLLPGAVQIFYGDETARPGDTGFHWDQPTRSFMNWGSENQAVLSHWQKLGQFRARHRAVGAGSHRKLQDSPYAFSRSLDGDTVVVVIGAGSSLQLDVSDAFADGTALRDGYSGQTMTVSNGQVSLSGLTSPGVVLLERVIH